MSIIGFEVPGQPVAKARARAGRYGHYTPAATELAQARIAAVARRYFDEPLVGPLHLDIIAVFSPAKSWSKKRTEAAIGKPHMQKPDADNIAKLVMDALNGIAYHDDRSVAKITVEKVWSIRPETLILISPLEDTWRQSAEEAGMSVCEVLSHRIARMGVE